MNSPAVIALIILAFAAPIGAFDVLYYHIFKYKLYARKESQLETVTHIFRGLIIATFAYMVGHYHPTGTWYWIISALLIGDFVNSLLDVMLETESRASLGGLPKWEYVVHFVGTTANGMITAVWIFLGWHLSKQPSSLETAREIPAFLVNNSTITAVGGVAIAITESILLLRARWQQRKRVSRSEALAV